MWVFKQSTGELFYETKLVEKGYAGHQQGVNNPKLQNVRRVGPLPQGTYHIGEPVDSANVGPHALPLTQQTGDTFGRSAFYIHGDNPSRNQSASHGCIVMSRKTRQLIVASGDSELAVVE